LLQWPGIGCSDSYVDKLISAIFGKIRPFYKLRAAIEENAFAAGLSLLFAISAHSWIPEPNMGPGASQRKWKLKLFQKESRHLMRARSS